MKKNSSECLKIWQRKHEKKQPETHKINDIQCTFYHSKKYREGLAANLKPGNGII